MPPAVTELMRIREDATTTADNGSVLLSEGHMRIALGPLGPGLSAALTSLTGPGAEESTLVAAVRDAENEQAILPLHMLLRRLEFTGWLERVVLDELGDPVVTMRPLGHQIESPPSPLARDALVALSRFAVLQAVDGEMQIQSPRAALSLMLHHPAVVAMLAGLARPRELAGLCVDGAGLSVEAARATLSLLVRARMVVAAGEEQDERLAHWSATDLLFHTRSRVGGNIGGYGGTYHLRDRASPLPAIKELAVPAVALERPDLAALVDDDVPFTRVIEERHSVRAHDDARPISAEQLGHFLFRSARVRDRFGDGNQELSSRPYPGGGAVYELELYPLVHNCAGLEPGLYHYDPAAHAVGRVAEPGPKVTLLCEYGRRTAVMDTPPQVLILIAARFARAMWKYESMAYALVLKDVGVLYQTMYLVGTAMGLAPCALGGGNSAAFADAAGLDPYAEATVGEFVLGSRAPAAHMT